MPFTKRERERVCVCGEILLWKGDLVIAIETREREREREIRCLHSGYCYY